MTAVDKSGIHHETSGEGPPIVFIHGLGATSNVWHSQRMVLSRNHRVIVYDRSGCGRSPPRQGGFSIDAWTDELAALLVRLDVSAAAVVGHSLGSMIAQRFAAKHPGRTKLLVLAGAEAELTPQAKAILTERAESIEAEGLLAGADRWLVGVLSPATRSANPALTGMVREMFLSNDPRSYAMQCRALRDASVRGDHGAIVCPTLLLVGDQDPVTPMSWHKGIAARIAGSRIRVIPDTAHMTMLESPSAFNTALLEFFASVDR